MRNWRDIPNEGYVNEHQRKMEELQRQKLIEQAIQHSEFLRRRRMQEAEARAEEKILEGLLCRLDDEIRKMEDQRDKNAPVEDPYGEWGERFCEAVQALPELKRVRDDVYFELMLTGKPEFYTV